MKLIQRPAKRAGISLLLTIALLLALLPAGVMAAPAMTAKVRMATNFAGTPEFTADISWDDSWFTQDSGTYQHPLALASLALSGAAYLGEDAVREALTALGFDAASVESHNYAYAYTREDNNVAAYTFAEKSVPDGAGGTGTLLAVVVRGSNTFEWYSNFSLGTGDIHEGFQKATADLRSALNAYLTAHGSDGLRILVTGHSRGGAVANLIAAELLRDGIVPVANLYGYTFAAPNVARTAGREGYANIFNIVNREDFVPAVPLRDWGYHRYGTDLGLPSRSDQGTGYAALGAKVAEMFQSVTGRTWDFYEEGLTPVRELMEHVLDLAPEAGDYDTQQHILGLEMEASGVGTLHDYFNLLADVLAQEGSWEDRMTPGVEYAKTFLGAYAPITRFFVTNSLSVGSFLRNRIFCAHSVAGYYCWLKSSDSPAELYGLPETPGSAPAPRTFRELEIRSGGDVAVTDASGAVVAQITGTTLESDTLAGEAEKKSRTLDIPGDQNYILQLTALEAETVDITVRAYTTEGTDVTVTDEPGLAETALQPGDVLNVSIPVGGAITVVEGGADSPSEPLYTDVSPDAWYAGAVAWADENGIMSGTGNGLFDPNGITTRGMIATLLYRMEGEPEPGDAVFSDVDPGAYYAPAVAWASRNGLADGYGDGRFGPGDPITRQQLAVFLYRYASWKGYDVSPQDPLDGRQDASDVASWALTAVKWAVAEALIQGTNPETLDPGATTNRAQVAAILQRFRQAYPA